MKKMPTTTAERILTSIIAGLVACSFISGSARAAELMDVLLLATETEEEQEAAPTPHSEIDATLPNEEPALSDDPIADNLSAEEKLEQLRLEVAKMQAELANKQDKPAPSKKFTVKPSGLLIMDAIAVDQSGGNQALYNDVNNNFAVRDARLGVKGEGLDGVVTYEATVAVQTDTSQRKAGVFFKNMFVNVKDVPFFQNVKVGHFKVETCMSERDFLINAPGVSYFSGNTMTFSPHRKFGIGSTRHYADKKLRIFTGLYSGQGFSDAAAVLDDAPGLILDTRITAVPIYLKNANDDLEEVFHIGGSGYWYLPGNDATTLKLRARPTSWTGGMQYLLNSAIPLESGYGVYEGEFAWQYGQLGIISETFVADIQNYGTSWGSTLAARYFLRPGNYRTYSLDGGGFAAPHLVNTAGKREGSTRLIPDNWGEFELVGMYAYTDLDNLKNVPSGSVTTIYGDLHEAIGGVNWWWSPDLRWSATYTKAYANSAKFGKEKNKTSNNTIDLQVSFQF